VFKRLVAAQSEAPFVAGAIAILKIASAYALVIPEYALPVAILTRLAHVVGVFAE